MDFNSTLHSRISSPNDVINPLQHLTDRNHIKSRKNSTKDRVSAIELPILPTSFRRQCLVCARPSRVKSYKNICRWSVTLENVPVPLSLLLLHVWTERLLFPLERGELEKEGKGRKNKKRGREKRNWTAGGRRHRRKVCLLRMRPKNWALKAARLLETLGATLRLASGLGNAEIMHPGSRECQYFHYFTACRRVSGPRNRPRSKTSADFFPFLVPRFLFFPLSSLPRKEPLASCFSVWSRAAIFLPSGRCEQATQEYGECERFDLPM